MNSVQPARSYRIPSTYFFLHESNSIKDAFKKNAAHSISDTTNPRSKTFILDNYFNDLYRLFISRFSKLGIEGKVALEDKVKLRSLLEELIKVKTILEKGEN